MSQAFTLHATVPREDSLEEEGLQGLLGLQPLLFLRLCLSTRLVRQLGGRLPLLCRFLCLRQALALQA